VSVRQAAFAILVILVLAGCGGGGGSSRLSKSEFDAKANAICDKYQAKINAVGQPQSVSDVPGYIDKVLPIIEEGTSKLDDLKPPQDIESTVNDWRVIQHTQIDEAKQLRDAAKKGDTAAVTKIANEAAAKNKSGNALAAQVGATSCAKN
jgi:hypothetical protein